VLNGENTFSFTVPGGQADAAYVTEGNLVAFKDLESYWQFFEIKRLVDLHGDGLTRTAFCEHIFYELLDDIVTDKRPSGSAIAALTSMLEDTRWQVGIVDDLGASSTSAYYESALSAVQKVANAWKGELNWRCVISGGVITRYVDLLAGRGTDTGKQFAYTKDIVSIEREVDASNVVTALYGRGKGVEVDEGSYGRRLTFADVEAEDKPLGQEWVGDAEALARWGRPGGRHRFDVFTDEEETDAETLLEKTRAELAKRKVPRITYRLDVVSLEQVAGYEHEQVRLGDLVRVIDREFRPELVVSARVVELERDLLQPAKTKIVLGSFAPTIVDATINTQRQVSDLQNKPFNTAWLDGKISILQNEIENVSSYVFQTADDGILIMDAPTFAEATKAMKLGGGIFALANSKTGDTWNWRTFGDGAGFTADEINAGKIQAQFVQIGSATDYETGYNPATVASDLDNFITTTYAADIAALQEQVDGKIETWFYEGPPTLSNAPAVDWITGELKIQHIGDLYYDLLTGYAYRFLFDDGVYGWDPIVDTTATQALALASLAKDTADNKRRVFVQTPTPPYDVGDLWTGGSTGDLKRCKTAKESGSYSADDWELATKYTDDSALTNFVANTYTIDQSSLQAQIDGKIETYFQETDPNTWTEADRLKHNGDMWYSSSTKLLKRYDGTTNSWNTIEDQKAIDAYTAASQAQDTADGKRRVFTTTPTPPYDVGDLWSEGSEGDLKRCKTAKDSEGVYSASDWELATKYTDDSTANSKNTTFSTCPSNGKYKKNDIMIPSEGFVSGAKTFYAGEIYQALADGDGVVFNPVHWAEASLISAWKKTGTTTIDGGQIATDTVTADKLVANTAMINFLNALNITAKYISASGITAGTLTLTANLNIESSDGNLEINGTQLRYTHADGTESRLGASGLRLYENGQLLPYISTVDAGMIDKFNETEGYWNYIVGNNYKKYFYLKRRGIRWLNQADNVKMLVTQGEELEWYDSSQYRHTGIKGMKYAVGDITNIAADVTVRSNTVSSGSTASMIFLDLGANDSDGYYAQEYITINGETRKIVQYDGGARRAYVDNSFSSAPLNGDSYRIHTGPGGVNIEVESWYLAPWYSGSSGGEYYYALTFGYMLILNN
jgi:phage minor structural protein